MSLPIENNIKYYSITASGSYSLSSLFKEVDNASSSSPLSITVNPEIKVELIDDRGLASDSQQPLECIVQRNASLSYVMRCTAAEELAVHPCSTVKKIALVLNGEGAYAQARAVYFGVPTSNITFETMQHHKVPHTSSFVEVKTVLDGASTMTCNSMIKVDKAAQRTDARQVNKNILLHSQARAVSVPQLEIEADDVSCKHGAAVSALNDEHFFYLQSRGLTRSLTQEMLIEAFLS